MNVFFGFYPDLFFKDGGLQTQILETKKALEEKGVNVYFYYEYDHRSGIQVDIYHQFSVEPACLPICNFFTKKAKVKILSAVFNHGFNHYEVKLLQVLNMFPGNFFNMHSKSSMYELFDHYIFLGKTEKIKCDSFFNKIDNYSFIPNGLTFSNTFDSVDKSNHIVHVGAVYPLKNQIYSIKLAKELNMKLYIIGDIRDNTYYKDCVKEAKETDVEVEYCGYMKNTSIDFKELVSEAKLMVIPSYSEVLPLVAFESLMLGTKVLCTDNSSIGEYLNFEKGLLLININKEPNLSIKKINSFLQYSHDFENIQSDLQAKYSWHKVASEIECLYENLISR